MFDAARNFFNEEKTEQESYGNLTLVETPSLHIALRTPKSLNDCQAYADVLMAGQLLIVSFNELEREAGFHAADYLAGVAYIMAATVTEVGRGILMYAPATVEVAEQRR